VRFVSLCSAAAGCGSLEPTVSPNVSAENGAPLGAPSHETKGAFGVGSVHLLRGRNRTYGPDPLDTLGGGWVFSSVSHRLPGGRSGTRRAFRDTSTILATSRILKTPRLRLEPFRPAFLTDRYVAWLNEPAVVRYSEQRHRCHTLQSAAAYLASFSGSPHYMWAILAPGEVPPHIGNITAHVAERHSVADIGIMIGERGVWGRGYGYEAWVEVCNFLLLELRVRKVTAGTASVNKGMLAIMQRAGMKPDGSRFRQHIIEGNEVDLVHMALFREDLAARIAEQSDGNGEF
jgi:[ribosomal protein S5]-alanine N-acetyltransferase